MATFDTIAKLPDVKGRRFGAVSLGHELIATVRDEHLLLRGAVATVLNKPSETVTKEDVELASARVRALRRFLDGVVAGDAPDATGKDIAAAALYALNGS